jgi:hypothetical protein
MYKKVMPPSTGVGSIKLATYNGISKENIKNERINKEKFQKLRQKKITAQEKNKHILKKEIVVFFVHTTHVFLLTDCKQLVSSLLTSSHISLGM